MLKRVVHIFTMGYKELANFEWMRQFRPISELSRV